MNTYICPHHGTEQTESCAACWQELESAPNPADMTPEQRVAELDRYLGGDSILTVPFDRLHARIEALAGGPVWTHQLIEVEWLREVVRRRNRDDCGPEIAIDQLAKRGKPIITLEQA